MGHTSISTIEIYARADTKLKREALEKAHMDVTKNENKSDPSWLKDGELLEWLKALK